MDGYTIEQKTRDFKTLFTSEVGVRVLSELDKQCKYRRDLFDPENDRVTSFNLGQNSVVRYIHGLVDKKDEPKQDIVENKGVAI